MVDNPARTYFAEGLPMTDQRHSYPFSAQVSTDVADVHAELASLREQVAQQRAANQYLTDQLALRDMALDSVSTHFAVAEITRDGGKTVYYNRALCEALGFRREELLSETMQAQDQGTNFSAERRAEIRAALVSGREYNFEEQATRRDGSTFWTGATLRPVMGADERVTHIVSISADITDKRAHRLKEAELQEQLVAEMKERERILIELRTAQKLESVGRLAAGVAHEINTPIQYVGDSLYFLRSSVADLGRLIDSYNAVLSELGDEAAITTARQAMADAAAAVDLPFLLDEMPKAFERTFEGTSRVAGIVRAMKEFSHPDATEFSSADINHALQTTLVVATNEYKYLAQVKTEFAELPPVICNIGELNQVFLNMIVNAAHAIHDAGKDVSTGAIAIVTAVDGDCVEITFSDNGCGIPQENLDKIYDPFFTTKEVGRGTGQGLAITRSIVMDKHGGEVHATSEVGVGTQFKIRLPIARRNAGVSE